MPVPILHSRPGASKKLWLSFDGYSGGTLGGPFVMTPFVGDAVEVWCRLLRYFAMVNLDITTEFPGPVPDPAQNIVHIYFGGPGSFVTGESGAGEALVGGYRYWAQGFVYTSQYNGNIPWMVIAAAHEAGHLYGLSHLLDVAGIMAPDPFIYSNPWWSVGHDEFGLIQNDLAVLTSVLGASQPMTRDQFLQAEGQLYDAIAGSAPPPNYQRIDAPNGTITDNSGDVWSWGALHTNQYVILKNGTQEMSGEAIALIYFAATDKMYATNASGIWYLHTASAWQQTSSPI